MREENQAIDVKLAEPKIFYEVTVVKVVNRQPNASGYADEQREQIFSQRVDYVDMFRIVRAVNPETRPVERVEEP